jgi:endonuclease/exonuclease/phosphatase family metal-dependent hydrolase
MVFSVCLSTLRRRLAIHALLFSVLAVAPGLASAQTTVTLDAPGSEVNVDTTIRGGGYGWANYAQDGALESKTSGDANYVRRILMKFDTQNKIPAGAVINSAKLYLTLQEGGNTSSRPFAAYRVTKSFAALDTSWYEYNSGLRWSSAGGDLGEKFTTTNVGNQSGQTYAFDLTDMVQRTVKGEFGSRYTRLALVDVGGADGGSYRKFHSSRSSNSGARPRLVVTYGGSSSGTQDVTTSSGTTLKVMSWNIHKTKGTDNACNADRTASWVAKLNVQVIVMNEVSYYSGSCSFTADQGAKLETLIEQKTGVNWNRKFLNSFGGSSGVGNLILSRLPFASTNSKLLSYDRGIVQAAVVVNGRTVNLFATHVDYANASWRTTQTNEVKNWTAGFASPRIVMGDFNTNPGTSDYYIMANAYGDSWVEAQKLGTATSYNGRGSTHGGSRFDYVYYTKNSAAVLKSVNVASTATNGIYASDHDPVIATFTIK